MNLRPPLLLLTLLTLAAHATLPAVAAPSEKKQKRPTPRSATTRKPVRPPLPDAETFLKPDRPLTLESAFDRALATAQSIEIAYYGVKKSNLLPWSSLTRMGPSLSGNLGYQTNTRYNLQNLETDPAAGRTRSDAVDRSAGISFVQPLFDPTVFPAYKNSKLSIQSARLRYRYTVRDTLFGVAQAFYEVLKYQKLVEVNGLTLQLAGDQLAQAKTRFELGDTARIDVLRAEASHEDARAQLIQSQGELEIQKNTLSNILNLGGRTDYKLAEPPSSKDPEIPFEEALAKAYSKREDLEIAKIAVEQEKTRRQEIAAGYAPRVTAQAGINWGSNTGGAGNRSEVHSGSIGVTMPFLTGGQREIDLKNAEYNIEESRVNLSNTVKEIEADVKRAWVRVATGKKRIVALQASVSASEQNYQDLRSQYDAGAATNLDVQVSLRELSNTRVILTNEVYNYQIALRDLQRAQATLEPSRVQAKTTR